MLHVHAGEITPEMALRILQVFEGTRETLESSDDDEEPARKRARKATVERVLELDDILTLCESLDPDRPDYPDQLARLEYYTRQCEANIKHGYFKFDPYGANKVRFPNCSRLAGT